MLGASIYLSEGIEKNQQAIKQLSEAGVRTLFTSLHIPEDDPKETTNTLKALTPLIQSHELKCIADVSSDTLKRHNIPKEDVSTFFTNHGVTHLRIDYGFSYEEIADLSSQFTIVLNASTIDEETCLELEKAGLSLSDVTVCHNFYPRKETGLDPDFFLKRNRFFKEKGFTIQAFIPGDLEPRGPVYDGLPTLEKHRTADALEAYLDLTQHYLVDEVLVGDIALSPSAFKRISKWITEGVVSLPFSQTADTLPSNFYTVHRNRKDVAEQVIRAEQSRIQLKEETIEPSHQVERLQGSITLDNDSYGRYKGELQITKTTLPKDERVNVLGKIDESCIGLLKYIGPGTSFQFEKRE